MGGFPLHRMMVCLSACRELVGALSPSTTQGYIRAERERERSKLVGALSSVSHNRVISGLRERQGGGGGVEGGRRERGQREKRERGQREKRERDTFVHVLAIALSVCDLLGQNEGQDTVPFW